MAIPLQLNLQILFNSRTKSNLSRCRQSILRPKKTLKLFAMNVEECMQLWLNSRNTCIAVTCIGGKETKSVIGQTVSRLSSTRTNLKSTREHTGEKPLKCLELGCNKSFRKKSALDAHKLVHSGGKPHHCLDCGKTFRHKYSLEEHKVTHISEKPYQCHECGKTFTLSRYLKNHQITHSGEKPYRCSAVDCGKAYTDSSGLLKHKKPCTRECFRMRLRKRCLPMK